MYSLNCIYFDKTFNSIDELIEHVLQHGMDPNYEITFNGESTHEQLIDLIQY